MVASFHVGRGEVLSKSLELRSVKPPLMPAKLP